MKMLSTLFNKFFALIILLLISFQSFSQRSENNKIWKSISEKEISFTGTRYTIPVKYKIYKLNIHELKNALINIPSENLISSDLSNGTVFSLPAPDGKFVDFKIVSYNVIHPALAANYPLIKTYTGRGIDDPSALIKLDLTPLGFHAMVLSSSGNFFIDPYCENNIEDYIAYYKSDLPRTRNFVCETSDELIATVNNSINVFAKSSGTQLRTYRLALACTGEYAATKGGTVAGALAGMATTMNRVNGVFETEVGIRMVIVANNNLICFTNASTDPYTNNNGSTMLGQNITTCNNIIGSANYDIGHVFSTGGGGVAYLNSPCGSSKAGGVTGSSNPMGDAYDIDYVAHEMGHQFGGNHTFNSTIGSCSGGNRNAGAAYEPGSGVTIMAYAGICGTDNISAHSIAYFHTKSFDEITTYTQTGNGNTCAVKTNTGNTPPIVNSMGNDYSIPVSTAFILSGSATDADNDPITYAWEQFDLGTGGAWNVQSTTAPMFRSFEPTTSGSRTFPKLSDILNNTTTIGELLPNQARTLKFRLTARDGRGGVMHPDNTINISVINNGGAFKINSPNTSVVWEGGSIKNVAWSVSGTTQSPINTELVKILLSTDGGYTFPIILLESTPNSGNADVTLPNIQTSQARIKVEAVGNIYFDICDNNFTINAATSLTTIATGSVTPLIYCAGNTVSIPFTIDKNANSGNTFTAQLSNSNGSFTSPLTIGTLTSISQGIINATIPSQITPGSGYRIRVVSSNPSIIGSNNGANITINNLPAASVISANGATTICQGSSVIIAGNNSGGTWSNGGSTSGSIIVNTSGDYFVTNTNSCGSNTSNHIYVTVNPLPIVSAGPYANVQTSTPAFSLAGSPAGGTFSGTGVSNNVFNPATAGVGNFQITYTYTNGNGCTNFNSTQINVEEGECIFSVGSIEGSINVCDFMDPQGGNATYTIEASGASSFTWTVPSNSVIVSGQGTNTIILDFSPSFVSGTIYVRITNACGGNPVKKYLNINSTIPNTPGLISGPTNPCLFLQGGVATYSIEKVLNASFYNWVVPAGANIISHPNGIGENDTIINVTYNSAFVSGSAISVKSGSYCGVSSSERSLIIKSPSISVPSKIFGQSDVCYAAGNSTLVKFSIKPVTNAISYNWSLSGNATIAQHPGGEGSPNDTIIYILIGSDFTTGSVRVSASNGCIISSERVLNLFIKAPNSPVKIFGNPNLVTGVSDAPILEVCDAVITGSYLVYSINKVKVATDESGFASSYNWEISDNVNAQITHPNGSGINDTIIRVYFGSNFTSATLGVSAERACKSSNARSISLYKKAPLPPGPISGQSQVCKEDIKSYSVEANSSTTYTWTTPSGIIILSGQGTPTIELQFTYQFTGGTLRVSASSACGNSSPVSLKLILCTAPAKPDLITKVNEEKNPDLLIYPNPSSGIFNLEFKNVKDNSKSNISITTIGGKLVYYSTEFLLEDKLSLNLRSKLSPGIYILKTMINGRFINKKLVIQ